MIHAGGSVLQGVYYPRSIVSYHRPSVCYVLQFQWILHSVAGKPTQLFLDNEALLCVNIYVHIQPCINDCENSASLRIYITLSNLHYTPAAHDGFTNIMKTSTVYQAHMTSAQERTCA